MCFKVTKLSAQEPKNKLNDLYSWLVKSRYELKCMYPELSEQLTEFESSIADEVE